VPAIAKRGHPSPDQEELVEYLDAVMTAHPETKVCNLSFSQDLACNADAVSYVGHALAMLARKHGVLLVNSIGNVPAACAKRPADCEAALTVGRRLHEKAAIQARPALSASQGQARAACSSPTFPTSRMSGRWAVR